jgi:hypothetical protein
MIFYFGLNYSVCSIFKIRLKKPTLHSTIDKFYILKLIENKYLKENGIMLVLLDNQVVEISLR